MEPLKRLSKNFTPEVIVGKLFSFHNRVHFLHLNADTIGKHKLLDELYKDLVEHKDSIAEFLLGIQAPTRLGVFTMDALEPFTDSNMMKVINEGINFSKELCDWSENRGWEELENLAAEVQASFVKAKLFTTYK